MKVMKIPCEHDLMSKDPEIWAQALSRCTGGNPYCGADGHCHSDGKCFADVSLTREQAILEMDRLKHELFEQQQENQRLRKAPEVLVQQLNLALDQNISKGNQQRVFAIRYCIGEIERNLK